MAKKAIFKMAAAGGRHLEFLKINASTMTIKRCSKGSIPIVKQFLGENFQVPSKMVPKMTLIRGNGGLDIRFCVRDPEKAHPWAEPRVLAYFAAASLPVRHNQKKTFHPLDIL